MQELNLSNETENNNWVSKLSNITYTVKKRVGKEEKFNIKKVISCIQRASAGFEKYIDTQLLLDEVIKSSFHGISTTNIEEALVLATTAFIEKDPAYSKVAARLLLQKLYKEITKKSLSGNMLKSEYKKAFITNIKAGVDLKIFTPELLNFDLEKLANTIDSERDDLFGYLGLQTISDRYLIKNEKTKVRLELPQCFWMRIAMGLALNENNKEEKAIEFYNVLSTMKFVSSTPTLLHSGLMRPQLSSCFLSTVKDDLHEIFKAFSDNANLAKWSGGVANDWTNIRATGALINTIKVESQGLIPFIKIASDTTAAINRSGKRRGAAVCYIEPWHYDFEEFLDLRRNTGDERRRAHDLNFASWIPDLFMKRVINNEDWTLFSPEEAPDLHSSYGKKFDVKFAEYEAKAKAGEIRLFKTMPASQLWKKMLTRLFETGYPWLTFKDPCNIRSPQDHVGTVNSSNLCTEITLNTSSEEIAVCNLGSINLEKFFDDNGNFDDDDMEETIGIAIRMLDNVVDINYYPVKETRTANLRHRPIGLGMMGFQDALFKQNLSYADPKTLEFADRLTEKFSYHAIMNSSKLAKERGTYSSYKGSKWSKGILPHDTMDILEKERGIKVETTKDVYLDWEPVRAHVKEYGMRNSNTMAIAPTATISNIAGCFPCIEPLYSNMYVKANMVGEFTVVNSYLVNDLKKVGLWSQDMLDEIKYFDGSIQEVASIPENLKHKYKGAFELDPSWLIKITAARGKWIDQSISHNVFMKGVSGQKLNEIYMEAWRSGLKTTYYLRTLGASQIEKSTLDAKKFGYTQKRDFSTNNTQEEKTDLSKESATATTACSLSNDPDCDVCQ
jgi:ribonucleoside-diphosphate reductase alpha chain